MNRLFIASEILKVAKELLASLKIEQHNRGYHDQQSDNSLIAKLDGKVVGYLDYDEYHDEVHIQMIEVDEEYRRKGIGMALLRELDKLYPETEILYGMETPEGAALIKEYQRRYPKKLDFERGVANRDFVMSFAPETGKNTKEVSWHELDYAFSEAGLDLNSYDFNWQSDKEKFLQDVKRVSEKGWAEAAKRLRSDLGIKTNAEVKVAGRKDNRQWDTERFPQRFMPAENTWEMPKLTEEPLSEITHCQHSITAAPEPTNDRQWIQEILKLEPSGALACSSCKSRKAFEFPTKEALEQYLREHPLADRKRHWIKKPTAPTPAQPADVGKKFGIHKVFDNQHPLDEKSEDRFRALLDSTDSNSPWQAKNREAIKQSLFKKLGQQPKFEDIENESFRRTIAAQVIAAGLDSAAKHTKDPTFKLDMVTDPKGIPRGIVTSYENYDHELEIGTLATSGQVKGMGTYLIAKTIREQVKKGQRVTLSAIKTARPFYEKIGMKPVDPIGPNFFFEHDDAVKFADRVYGELGAPKVASLVAVSELPNDVMEKVHGEEYPQEYMSPSPSEVGSVRPGDDKLLTGRIAERIARDLLAAYEKKHYRYDPGHRRKPGPGWTPTEAGWSKPRPTQLQKQPVPPIM
jgi:GNAT superfamily N-acetyltransferase